MNQLMNQSFNQINNELIHRLNNIIFKFENNENVFELLDYYCNYLFNEIYKFINHENYDSNDSNYVNIYDFNSYNDSNDNINSGANNKLNEILVHIDNNDSVIFDYSNFNFHFEQLEKTYSKKFVNLVVVYKLGISIIECCKLYLNINEYLIFRKSFWIKNFVPKGNNNNIYEIKFINIFKEMKNILLNGYNFI